MKQFRITEDNQVIEKFDTLQQCVDCLNKLEMGLHGYYVEDLENDIEVDGDEVLEVFDRGESPKDLTFF